MSKLKRVDPDGFTNAMRYEADHVYSELSKAIHQEFVVPAVAQYDVVTVGDLIDRSWEFVANLGITACFSPTAFPLNDDYAIECYESAQKELYR